MRCKQRPFRSHPVKFAHVNLACMRVWCLSAAWWILHLMNIYRQSRARLAAHSPARAEGSCADSTPSTSSTPHPHYAAVSHFAPIFRCEMILHIPPRPRPYSATPETASDFNKLRAFALSMTARLPNIQMIYPADPGMIWPAV